jgi:hypothetical protein
MAQPPRTKLDSQFISLREETKSNTWAVLFLAIMFFGGAIILVMAARYLQIDPVWELLAVPFNLAMTGALILFHFLSSSATIDKQVYKVGGAIAGFLVLFTLFYNVSRDPFLTENEVIRFAQNPLSKRFLAISDRYSDITALKNGTLTKVADSNIQNLRATFDQLAQGTYEINAAALSDVLNYIIQEVIETRRTRAFLFPTNANSPEIDRLYDARLLHLLKKSISSKDDPGRRYDVYKIDYGCYVDLISTSRAPMGLLAGEEDGKYVDVPPDDYRSIRRAILHPGNLSVLLLAPD